MMLGPLDSLNIVIDLVKSATATASASLTGAALSILAACVGIVIVKAWLESILENDAVGFVGESLEVLIVGTVCTMVINGIGTINSMAWGLMDSAMTAMGGGAGGTGSAVDRIWSSTINTTSYFFGFYAQQSSDCSLTHPMECFAALADNILLSLALIVVMLLLLVYVAVMLLQVIRGVFMIAAGLIWLPLATGFYPLNESWAKNAVGVIASGIAFMGMVAFLLGIVTQGADLLVKAAVAGDFNHIPGVPTTTSMAAASAPGDMLPRAFGAMTVAVMLFVLAMAAGTAMSKASEIFGSVGGMLRVHRPRGSRGGKQSTGGDGKNAGPTTTPAPAPAPTPSGGGPSGAAIQGVAAVGTSGASTAASGAAEVAGATAGQAASTADAAGAGAGGLGSAADGVATPGGAPGGASSAPSAAASATPSATESAAPPSGDTMESAGSSGGGGLRGEARHAASGAHAMGMGAASAAMGGALGAAKGVVGAMRGSGRGGLIQHGGSAVGRAAMAGMKAGAAGGVAQMRAGASAIKAGAIGAVKATPGAAGRAAVKAAGFAGRGVKQGAGAAGKLGGFVAHNMMEN